MKKLNIKVLFIILCLGFLYSNSLAVTYGQVCPICDTNNISNACNQCPECGCASLVQNKNIGSKFTFEPEESDMEIKHILYYPPNADHFLEELKQNCAKHMPPILHNTIIDHVLRISFCAIESHDAFISGISSYKDRTISVNIGVPQTVSEYVGTLTHEAMHFYDCFGKRALSVTDSSRQKDCILSKNTDVGMIWREMRAHTIEAKIDPSSKMDTPKKIWHNMFENYPNMPRYYEQHNSITSSEWYNSENLENFFDDGSLTSETFTNTMRNHVRRTRFSRAFTL